MAAKDFLPSYIEAFEKEAGRDLVKLPRTTEEGSYAYRSADKAIYLTIDTLNGNRAYVGIVAPECKENDLEAILFDLYGETLEITKVRYDSRIIFGIQVPISVETFEKLAAVYRRVAAEKA